mgnify:CR=1 FL=1
MYTVLCISCHPDDMEVACAGTLLKCKERGDRVVVCHLSSGNLGHEIIPPDELSVMRANEAKRAGAELIIIAGDLFDTEKISRRAVGCGEGHVDVANAVPR